MFEKDKEINCVGVFAQRHQRKAECRARDTVNEHHGIAEQQRYRRKANRRHGGCVLYAEAIEQKNDHNVGQPDLYPRHRRDDRRQEHLHIGETQRDRRRKAQTGQFFGFSLQVPLLL